MMAASPSTSGISADFDWIAGKQDIRLDSLLLNSVEFTDYDVFLDQIATTDIVQYAISLGFSRDRNS